MLDGLTPPKQLWITPPVSKIIPLALVSGVVVISMALTGCNSNSSLTGKLNSGNFNGSLPPEVTAQKELLDTAGLEGMGRPNPFVSLLEPPKTEEPEIPGEALPEIPAITYEDPYEGFSVGGIVYKAKRPLAILTMPEGGSKIIHIGDVLPTADGAIQTKVTQISQETVTLKVINPPDGYPAEFKSRSMGLSKIVGFRPTGAGSSKRSSRSKKGGSESSGGGSTDTSSLNVPGIPPELQQLLGGANKKQ